MTVPNHQPAIVWDEEKSPETSDLGQIRDDAEFHCHDNPYLMVKTSHFPSFPSTLRKKGHYLPMKAIVAPLRTSPQVAASLQVSCEVFAGPWSQISCKWSG